MAQRGTERQEQAGSAEGDAQVYATTTDPEFDDDAYVAWADRAAASTLADLDVTSDDHPPA